MTAPDDRPGYKLKKNKDGSSREYWAARSDLALRGYQPKAVRLHYDETDDSRKQLAAKCRVLQAEMLAWAANDGKLPSRGYDGTIGSLCRIYQTDELTPFRRMKWNAQENVAKSLKIIIVTVGPRQVGKLLGPDFIRWHDGWCAPKAVGLYRVRGGRSTRSTSSGRSSPTASPSATRTASVLTSSSARCASKCHPRAPRS
jgi:hypothetical protein